MHLWDCPMFCDLDCIFCTVEHFAARPGMRVDISCFSDAMWDTRVWASFARVMVAAVFTKCLGDLQSENSGAVVRCFRTEPVALQVSSCRTASCNRAVSVGLVGGIFWTLTKSGMFVGDAEQECWIKIRGSEMLWLLVAPVFLNHWPNCRLCN